MNHIIPVGALYSNKTKFVHYILINLNEKNNQILYGNSKKPACKKLFDTEKWGGIEYLFFNLENGLLFIDRECKIKFHCLFCLFYDDLDGFECSHFVYNDTITVIAIPK